MKLIASIKKIVFKLLFITILIACQNTNQKLIVEPLSVGDRLTSAQSRIITEASKTIVNVESDNSLIIFQFIDTHCSVSRNSVPILQELQQTFHDDLKIILVTHEKDSLVQEIAMKYDWQLPIITGDTTIGRLFPYQIVPHQVWLKGLEVKAITDWQYATEENFRRLINGENVKTNLKKEEIINLSEPLIASGIQPVYQSAITSRINAGSGIRRLSNHFLAYNARIKSLYRIAYGMPNFPTNAYVHVEVNDSLSWLIDGPSSDITGDYKLDSVFLAWRDRYTFCYNLVYPEGITIQESELHSKMQMDLNYFFQQTLGITAFLEKKLVKCFVLINTDNGVSYHTKGGNPFLSRSSQNYRIINQPLSLLIGQIRFRHNDLGMPVINNTGYSGNVDISFPGDLGDLNNVNKGLEKYGLQFVEKELEQEVVVISEVNDNSL